MKVELNVLQSSAIAPSTLRTYLVGQASYARFCQSFNLCRFPLLESTLRLFVTFLARSLSYASIKTYLAAVRYKNIELGFAADLQNMQLLNLLLRGVKRSKGEHIRPLRLPITLPLLKVLKESLRRASYAENDKVMLLAASTTAFFGFLRSAEFCCVSSTFFNPSSTLLVSNVSSEAEIFIVNIKVSKVDPFRRGHSIRLAPSGTSVCPVRALSKHLLNCRDASKPLFMFADGKYLTRELLTHTVQSLLQGTPHTGHYTSHSFRIGAATTAAAAHIPDWLIKILGRWSSNCYERYIRTPSNVIDHVSCKLASTSYVRPNDWHP